MTATRWSVRALLRDVVRVERARLAIVPALRGGLGMLVNQGVISIRHWTGVNADSTVMRRKLEELFGAE